MHYTRDTYGEDETRALGRAFAETLPADAVVAFSGDLGSGKTAFIRGICDTFSCGGQVSSPTFTIVNEYAGSRRVTHCDLYRLDNMTEMLEIGLDALFRDGGTVLVEWAERALPLLPLPRYEIAAAHGDSEAHRRFTVQLLEADAGEADAGEADAGEADAGEARPVSILAAPAALFRRKA
ncbi:MAG: tRNA (adenosine(37)-N6)-threonylcarbamoyltransferase complex ATPase subunit type 1 TsaE [Bacteroidota bacterium]|nr:tRNA (adenosine(37)-N6)-threonylcarbamoyltransferase complex ATPase subunit type 1 TsaE [Bacteroidota bacterium]